MWLLWLFSLLLIVLGIVFLCGKGSFLIAGYNTMSPAEKAQWDEKALCKAMGVLMFVCAGCFAVIGLSNMLHNNILLAIGIISVFISVIVAVVYMNTSKKLKRK